MCEGKTYPDGTPLFDGDSLDDNPQGGYPEGFHGGETWDAKGTLNRSTHPNAELLDLVSNPTTPGWLVELIPTLIRMDPVDVANAFDHMKGVLDRRLDLFMANAQIHIQTWCNGCRMMRDDVKRVKLNHGARSGPPTADYCPACREALKTSFFMREGS